VLETIKRWHRATIEAAASAGATCETTRHLRSLMLIRPLQMSHHLALGMPFAFIDGRIVTRANPASAKATAEEAVKVLDKL
jgi:hypothetical protein